MLLHFLGSRVNTDPRSRQTRGFTTQSNSIFELHRGKLLKSVEYYRSHKINIEVICVLPVAGLAASDAMPVSVGDKSDASRSITILLT
jgi:hypothetical protein